MSFNSRSISSMPAFMAFAFSTYPFRKSCSCRTAAGKCYCDVYRRVTGHAAHVIVLWRFRFLPPYKLATRSNFSYIPTTMLSISAFVWFFYSLSLFRMIYAQSCIAAPPGYTLSAGTDLLSGMHSDVPDVLPWPSQTTPPAAASLCSSTPGCEGFVIAPPDATDGNAGNGILKTSVTPTFSGMCRSAQQRSCRRAKQRSYNCARRLPCCTNGIHAAGGDGPLDRYAQRHGRTAVAITDHACGGGSPVFVHSGLRRLRVHTYGRHRRERRHGRAQVVGGRHILGPEPVSVRASR